jgi:hypothetical protein
MKVGRRTASTTAAAGSPARPEPEPLSPRTAARLKMAQGVRDDAPPLAIKMVRR